MKCKEPLQSLKNSKVLGPDYRRAKKWHVNIVYFYQIK